MPLLSAFTLRPGKPEERQARMVLVEQAWHDAYKHIYTPDEINGVFDSTLASYGDWTERRVQHLDNITAEADGQVIGYIGLARLRSGGGEVAALYVKPAYQNQGVGKALWDAGCERLRELGFSEVWVWTISRAVAVEFYRRQGCIAADKGEYQVGEHYEPAIGFRMSLG